MKKFIELTILIQKEKIRLSIAVDSILSIIEDDNGAIITTTELEKDGNYNFNVTESYDEVMGKINAVS